MANSSKRDARKLDLAVRRQQALKLRLAGVSLESIAEKLGYAHKSNASKDIRGAIKEIYREAAEEVRTLELERLDRIMFAVWQKAIAGDSAAIDRVLRIMDRRAQYLGLDSPKETSVEVKSDSRERIFARLQALTATAAGTGFVPPQSK